MSQRPACENFDPEIWYPETKKQNNKRDMEEVQKAILKGVEALKVCSTCPLLANGKCLDYTFENLDGIKYGISAGLLPNEKRKMIGFYMSDISEPFWLTIRKIANEQGIPVPPQPKREKPKKLYDIDVVIRQLRKSEPSDAE